MTVKDTTTVKVIGILVGAILGLLIGLFGIFARQVVLINEPAEQYYSLTQPIILTKKTYSTCKKGEFELKGEALRTATTDLQITASTELIELKEDRGKLVEVDTEVTRDLGSRPISKGITNLQFTFRAPCILGVGRYKFRGITKFEVRNITKFYTWETETFLIVTPDQNKSINKTLAISKLTYYI